MNLETTGVVEKGDENVVSHKVNNSTVKSGSQVSMQTAEMNIFDKV